MVEATKGDTMDYTQADTPTIEQQVAQIWVELEADAAAEQARAEWEKA